MDCVESKEQRRLASQDVSLAMTLSSENEELILDKRSDEQIAKDALKCHLCKIYMHPAFASSQNIVKFAIRQQQFDEEQKHVQDGNYQDEQHHNGPPEAKSQSVGSEPVCDSCQRSSQPKNNQVTQTQSNQQSTYTQVEVNLTETQTQTNSSNEEKFCQVAPELATKEVQVDLEAIKRKESEDDSVALKNNMFELMAQLAPDLRELYLRGLVDLSQLNDPVSVKNKLYGNDIDIDLLTKGNVVSIDNKIAICIGNANFDKAKLKNGDKETAMSDLPNSIGDAHRMARSLSCLGFRSRILTDLEEADYEQLIRNLKALGSENTDHEILLCVYVSSHGLVKSKQQHVLLNEDPKSTTEFKTFDLEHQLRDVAITENVRVIALFDCCRQQAQTEKDFEEQREQTPNFFVCYGCKPGGAVDVDCSISRDLIKMLQDEMVKNSSINKGAVLFPRDLVSVFKKFQGTEVSGTFDEQVVLQFREFLFTDKADWFQISGVDRRAPYLIYIPPNMTQQTKNIALNSQELALSEKGVEFLDDADEHVAELKSSKDTPFYLLVTQEDEVKVNGVRVETDSQLILVHRDLITIKKTTFKFIFPLQLDVIDLLKEEQESNINEIKRQWTKLQNTRTNSYFQTTDVFTYRAYKMDQIYEDQRCKQGYHMQKATQSIFRQVTSLQRRLNVDAVTDSDLRIAVIIQNSDYSHTDYEDLPQAANDALRMENLFSGLDFQIRRLNDLQKGALQRSFRQYINEQEDFVRRRMKVCWAFYASGHGATIGQSSHLILNEIEPNSRQVKTFPVEAKIRALIGAGNVYGLAIFDICRDFWQMRGPLDSKIVQKDTDNFCFVSASGPGVAVRADSKLTYRLPKHMKEMARDHDGYFIVPDDFEGLKAKVPDIDFTDNIKLPMGLKFKPEVDLTNIIDEEDYVIDGVDRRFPHLIHLKQTADGKTFQINNAITFGVGSRRKIVNIEQNTSRTRQLRSRPSIELPNIQLTEMNLEGIIATVRRNNNFLYELVVEQPKYSAYVFVSGKGKRCGPQEEPKPIALKHGDRIQFNENNVFLFLHPVQNQIFMRLRDQFMYPFLTPKVIAEFDKFSYPQNRRFKSEMPNTRYLKLSFLNSCCQAIVEGRDTLNGFLEQDLKSLYKKNPKLRESELNERLRDQQIYLDNKSKFTQEMIEQSKQQYSDASQLFKSVKIQEASPFFGLMWGDETLRKLFMHEVTALKEDEPRLVQICEKMLDAQKQTTDRAQSKKSLNWALANIVGCKTMKNLDLFLFLNEQDALWLSDEGSQHALLMRKLYPEISSQSIGRKHGPNISGAQWIAWNTFYLNIENFINDLDKEYAHDYSVDQVFKDRDSFDWQTAQYEWPTRVLTGSAKFSSNGWLWDYSGQFDSKGAAQGLGFATNQAGAKYFGMWNNNKRHQLGVYQLPGSPKLPLYWNKNEVTQFPNIHLELEHKRQPGTKLILYEATNLQNQKEQYVVRQDGFSGFGTIKGGKVMNGHGIAHTMTDWMNVKWYQEGLLKNGKIQGNPRFVSELGHTWTGKWELQDVDLINDLDEYKIPRPNIEKKGPYKFQMVKLYKKSGKGVLTTPNGNSYEGDFSIEYPEGYGEQVKGFEITEGEVNSSGQFHGYANMLKNYNLNKLLGISKYFVHLTHLQVQESLS